MEGLGAKVFRDGCARLLAPVEATLQQGEVSIEGGWNLSDMPRILANIRPSSLRSTAQITSLIGLGADTA